jgi:hypothetical protein
MITERVSRGKGRVKTLGIWENNTVACKIKGYYLAFVFCRGYLAPSKDG